jgi:hypothetical protein
VQREQFLRPKAASDGDERDRPLARVEFGRDRLNLSPGVEREHVAPFVPLPFRVLDADGGVAGREVPCDGPRERLPKRPEPVVA